MELNRRFGNDIIAGPFFIVGDSCDGKFISLIGQIKIVPMMKKYELES